MIPDSETELPLPPPRYPSTLAAISGGTKPQSVRQEWRSEVARDPRRETFGGRHRAAMTTTTDSRFLLEHLHDYFPLSLPLHELAWRQYELKPLLTSDDRRFTNLVHHLRIVALHFNEQEFRRTGQPSHIPPGDLVTAAVLTDIFRWVLHCYAHLEQAHVFDRAHDQVALRIRDAGGVERTKRRTITHYPPLPMLRDGLTLDAWIAAPAPALSNRELAIGEIVLLALAHENRAFRPFRRLFDDTELTVRTSLRTYQRECDTVLANEPPFSRSGLPILETLRLPLRAAPDSLDGQLEYVRREWGAWLPSELMEMLLHARDVREEERRLRGMGDGPPPVLRFGYASIYDDYAEPEAFSQDRDWMSNVVIIAKSTLVWLDQLAKRYRRPIERLDQIPDEELDRLARWGFSGLWLIGLWERSAASAEIKRMTGNPEAASSAYSLYDYEIAHELGGYDAFANLRDRAWQRGIRLASDMVPNHVGVHSRWVIEHPDWFVQLSQPPFPWYSYTGVNLAHDDRVVVQIEDGYWDRRDAAVVFKRIDTHTGDTRYIYHGNDGTSMPWNDTAQLNFLIPEVREAVIQTILHVARQFPIIRFDAAMTLAKRHFQRLWFPIPGDGGAIPTRAEHGLSRPEFDAVFPLEFWREVVDRVAVECPDTLLLAEAFWLMEGYFVRTLGMHRVYNSAFMNMLKMEENQKYRETVKNVLEFSPEVLKRFVNFMSNPDERTAIDQFGDGDKYFGVAMMMVTMPGLPMWGHGQIEGFTEKYGMEYRRAYHDEQPNDGLVRRHEHEIFPLMRRRHLFSGAELFALYDYITPDGHVDEDVHAYTNRAGEERAIVVFNNKFKETRGWIKMSTPINIGPADSPQLITRSLSEALALRSDDRVWYTFRDRKSGVEYLRSGSELANSGLYTELHAYQYYVFTDWHERYDSDGSLEELAAELGGGGVDSVERLLAERRHAPVMAPFATLLEPMLIRDLSGANHATAEGIWRERVLDWLHAAGEFADRPGEVSVAGKAVVTAWERLIALDPTHETETLEPVLLPPLATYLAARAIGGLFAKPGSAAGDQAAAERYDQWLLGLVAERQFVHWEGHEQFAARYAWSVAILLRHPGLLAYRSRSGLRESLVSFFGDWTVRQFLAVNSWQGDDWFNKEQFEWIIRLIAERERAEVGLATKSGRTRLIKRQQTATELIALAAEHSYQVAGFLDAVAPVTTAKPKPRARKTAAKKRQSQPKRRS